MKKSRQLIGYTALIYWAMCTTSIVRADFLQPKNQVEAYSPPPEENEFIPFGDDTPDSAMQQKKQNHKRTDLNPSDLNETSKFYLGGDLGIAFLDPSIDNNNYSNVSNKDLGLGITGGFSWSKKIQLEAQYHSLGTAEIRINNDNLTVKYQVLSFDMGYNFWQNTNSSAYASIGLAALSTSSSASIQQENSTGLKVGLGYAFFLNKVWSTRMDYHQFSGDSALLSIGLNRYFGRTSGNQ